jgi:hypothetical protein
MFIIQRLTLQMAALSDPQTPRDDAPAIAKVSEKAYHQGNCLTMCGSAILSAVGFIGFLFYWISQQR